MSSSSVSLGRNLVSLKWEEFNIFVVSELAALYQKDDLTDVTLFCEGRSFRAHKVLLSLWSTYFRDVFRGTTHSHPVVILKETNSSDLELILRFIYQGHLLIPIEETDRFLKTAEHFQVAGLKNMRNHVPNFTYSSGSGGNGNAGPFHEDPATHQQQPSQQTNLSYESSPTNGGGSTLITLASPQNVQSHQQSHGNHFKGGSTNPGSQSASTISLGGGVTPSSIAHAGPPQPPPPSSTAMDTGIHHSALETTSNQQQVIRQGSSRSIKHVISTSPSSSAAYSSGNSSTLGFQSNAGNVPSSTSNNGNGSGNGVGVVTRVASDSVIYQPQPVLIFQNGPAAPPVPMIKAGESQYITRGVVGADGSRSEHHSMMVIEGVVGDAQVHIEPSTSAHSTGTTAYTVYAHPPLSPPPNPPQASSSHHSSPEVAGSNEEILGLPYNATPNSPSQNYSHHPTSREVITIEESGMSSQNHHAHHSHHIQHVSHEHPEMETSTVVVSHPYNSSTASSTYDTSPLQNGSNSNNSNISSINSSLSLGSSSSSPSISKAKSTATEQQPPVYAVKRIPPPLPPSSPNPQSSRTFKNTSTIKTNISPKGKSLQGPLHNQPTTPVSTRSKSSIGTAGGGTGAGGGGGGGSGIKVLTPNRSSHTLNPSTSSNPKLDSTSSSSSKSYSQPSFSSTSSTSTPNRKVVLVPCPKCGKKVKQTSLKVHMKRTHLEEGTVLVCPICSKRISSKGVYYKHMYIHRKRSELDCKPATAATSTIIKNETQGT